MSMKVAVLKVAVFALGDVIQMGLILLICIAQGSHGSQGNHGKCTSISLKVSLSLFLSFSFQASLTATEGV
jgi:hypothetical protein